MPLLWFFLGAVLSRLLAIVYGVSRLNNFRRQSCTSCGRVARRLVKTYDLETGETRLGILCVPCAIYFDQTTPPPWAHPR